MTPRRPATESELAAMSPSQRANYEKWRTIPRNQVDHCPLGIGLSKDGKVVSIADPVPPLSVILDPRYQELGRLLDNKWEKPTDSVTDKYFNDRHDARVAAGNQPMGS